jgi:catabolite regulation protein CreA
MAMSPEVSGDGQKQIVFTHALTFFFGKARSIVRHFQRKNVSLALNSISVQ